MNNFFSVASSTLHNFRNSNFYQILWPIKSFEFTKFIQMATLMFTILLNQNLIRALKDSFIMTIVGPEVISFIKLWCEMPAGILFVIIYSKLCNIMTTEQVFRIIVVFFLTFFAVFAFILYPYQFYFHPDPVVISYYVEQHPHVKWFIVLWGKWSFILFYVMGELWPIVIFTLLFWQLANKITKTEEAKRFYSFFNLFGQSNLLISGIVICYFVKQEHFLLVIYGDLEDTTEVVLKSIITVVIFTGLISLCLHYFIEKKIISNKYNTNIINRETIILNLGLKDSIKMIMKSRYLGFIFLLIFSYNTTINLIEGLWMSKVKTLYPMAQDFMNYQGNVLFWTGVFTIFCTFIGSIIIRRYGWFIGAIVTPVMITVVGMLFFILIINEEKLNIICKDSPLITPLIIIVFIGGLQNVLCKGTKYSLFDTTKEMSYIPLDNEMKTKGKAAVDIIGTKIGKSLGSIIQFVIFTTMPNSEYQDVTGFLATIFGAIGLIWILGVKVLAKEYNKLLKQTS